MSVPLLTTKFYIPPARSGRVPRPRLSRRLAEGLTRKLTLLSAPAGFGKTTLLAECMAGAGDLGLRVCWLSLDEADNDAPRFLTYVVAAWRTVQREYGESVLAMLRSPQPPALENLLTDLINDLAQAQPFVMVLDDYHVIHTAEIHQMLAFLLDHSPPPLRLVIATRSDPPLPLARLRARGELMELRARELRFGVEEAAAFLNQTMGLKLSGDEVAALEARTEGWIAALQLAALSLQGRADAHEFINAFGGSHAYIVDYLLEEVLRRQPADTQEFLLTTSVLERLSGSLCDALTARADGQRMLERLQLSNLFVVPLDDERRWFRYHHLFADVLRGRLQQEHPDRLLELHRRAGAWFEQHGFVAEAVSHALEIRDWETMSRLVEQHGERLFERGEAATLRRWLDELPPDVIGSHPGLSLIRADLFALAHRLEQAEQSLLDAERGVLVVKASAEAREQYLNEALVRRVILALSAGDLTRTIQLAGAALARLPAGQLRLRGSLLLRLGIAYFQTGHLSAAQQALSESSRLSQQTGDIQTALQAIDNQSSVVRDQGRLREAAALCRQAVELAVSHGVERIPIISFVLSDLGEYDYEWNDLVSAHARLLEALERGEQGWQPRAMTKAYIALARVLQAQHELFAANEALRAAQRLIDQYQLPLFFSGPADACQVRFWLASGNVAAAAAWAQGSETGMTGELTVINEIPYLARARVFIAQGTFAAATAILARVYGAAESVGRIATAIEAQALAAIAHDGSGDITRAQEALQRALALAEPEGLVRTFVDEGKPMRLLLAGQMLRLRDGGTPVGSPLPAALAVDSNRLVSYVERLLAAFDESPSSTPPRSDIAFPISGAAFEPLNERETEVLRLISDGLSNREIADRLIIALSTVKWHINNLYGKLGVRSRTEVLARARDLGLL